MSSLNEHIDVVFYSVHSINLPDWDFEAQSLHHTLSAYYLAVYA